MRVLLVDDDYLVREALARGLRRFGLDVDEASGVANAHALLDRTAYGIVISDEHMGDGCGHALLAQVASKQPACHRALVSAMGVPTGVSVVWERFFAKPEGMEALIRWAVAGANP